MENSHQTHQIHDKKLYIAWT